VSVLAATPDWALALIALTVYLSIAYPASKLYFRWGMGDEVRAEMSKADLKDALNASIFAGLTWPLMGVVMFCYAGLSFIFGGWKRRIEAVESLPEKAKRLEREHRETVRAAALAEQEALKEKERMRVRIAELEQLNHVGPYALSVGETVIIRDTSNDLDAVGDITAIDGGHADVDIDGALHRVQLTSIRPL